MSTAKTSQPEAVTPEVEITEPQLQVQPGKNPNEGIQEEVVGCVVSRVAYPLDIGYNGGTFRLSPRARTESDLVKRLLAPLPVGAQFLPVRSAS